MRALGLSKSIGLIWRGLQWAVYRRFDFSLYVIEDSGDTREFKQWRQRRRTGENVSPEVNSHCFSKFIAHIPCRSTYQCWWIFLELISKVLNLSLKLRIWKSLSCVQVLQKKTIYFVVVRRRQWNVAYVHTAPDEFSTGRKFVRLGVLFTRNHLNRTII